MRTVIKRFAIDRRIRAGYGTAFLLLLLSYLLTLYANSELLKQAHLVNHSNRILINMEGLMSSIKDAETGLRGYISFKDSSFLEPYKSSKANTDSLYDRLVQENLDNPDQLANLQSLRQLLTKKYQLLADIKSEFIASDLQINDSLKSKAYFSKEIMGRIRETIDQMQANEQLRLRERSREMTTRFHTLNTIILVSLMLGFLLAIYGFLAYTRENNARRIADRKVSEYQDQLQQRIQELDKANKELVGMRSIEKFAATGRIARTIAHEVRNPLTNINLAVDQLKSDMNGAPGGNGNATLLLDMINRNSLRINQLITDLLNSTKFAELSHKRVSINQILDETLELAKDRIELNNIWVEKKYSDGICDVSVDIERIKIAFLNIIVNAIEAMEPGHGILQIKTEDRDNRCVVTITDNGSGIDAESLSKLFEPYFTSKTKGTGLGLTNTQNIILNHNGHISTESAVGKGTAFSITLNFV
ncbi:MAG: CHASE3 domain-containing protein [Puia sp.]|nr:CHASE3 domain-containing protein [Puia sp.]